MTAEQYVRQVTGKICCGKERKQDIEKQLLAEIEERLEQGEALEDIIKEMGDTGEVAESFNENISPEERKQYKRKRASIVMAVVILVLAFLGFLVYRILPKAKDIESSGTFSAAEVETAVQKVIELLDADDFDTLRSMATPRMAESIGDETLKYAREQICDGVFGQRQSIGTVYAQEVEQRGEIVAVCQVNVSYENVAVTYTLSFDGQMKLVGLYMR